MEPSSSIEPGSRTAAVLAVRALMVRDPKRYGTQMLLAGATGLSQTAWSQYLRGAKKPNKHSRKMLRRKLGIDPGAWDSFEGVNNGTSTARVTQGAPSEERAA